MRKVFNSVNVCTAISGTSLVFMVGFVDGGNYIASVIFGILFAAFSYLALREDGYFRKNNRPR